MTTEELRFKCVELALVRHERTGGDFIKTAKEIENYVWSIKKEALPKDESATK